MVTAACVGGLLLGAVGCTAAPKPAPPSATPTIAPIFVSDEEALAAATEAYANYLSTYDAIWTEGGPSVDDYLALSTGPAHEGEVAAMTAWQSKGWKAIGQSTFDSVQLQSVWESDSGRWHIRTYLCADASGGDVIDASGQSVAKSDRPLRLPLEVEFVTASAASSDLKISESKVWSGSNFC
ncbi:hypothetical protein E3O42_16040 [Cryobacterium adonitolivorans]|uniref:Lipoprotein n=1 Tax=Cryobacterium adonitolivorans TaxID=1259189 RepID=A0A4R8VZM7_9MICO|nr:hypothetical protein [Cryobacterium adonitolivorans]TFB97457.1 hypothetical protein E3O42_16040 [Cryobacterium adonitolivorans]